MRTTLDLPEQLVKAAMKVTHFKTKTALIKHALADIVRRHKVAGLRKYRGKIDLDIDLDALRENRCKF